MSKEEEITTGRKYLVEIAGDDYRIAVHCLDWSDAISQVCAGRMKMRIAALAGNGVGYDSKSGRWLPVIPENVGQVKERVGLALLLAFPDRISREYLSVMSSVQMGSLGNYLTKPDLEVKPHIIENKDGVVLNETGLQWALQVFQSLGETSQPD